MEITAILNLNFFCTENIMRGQIEAKLYVLEFSCIGQTEGENGGLADFYIAIDLTLAMFSSYFVGDF